MESIYRDLLYYVFLLTLIWLVYRVGTRSKLLVEAVPRAIEAFLVKITRFSQFKVGFFELTVPAEVEEAAKSSTGGPRVFAGEGRVAPVKSFESIGSNPQETIDELIERAKLASTPYLLHSAKVEVPWSQGSHGRYVVRLWIEFDKYCERDVSEVEIVGYKLHETFGDQTFLYTSDGNRQFEVWLVIYGEFTVRVVIRYRDGSFALLSRYIDLPDRPPE